jgi:hypothetical protein
MAQIPQILLTAENAKNAKNFLPRMNTDKHGFGGRPVHRSDTLASQWWKLCEAQTSSADFAD